MAGRVGWGWGWGWGWGAGGTLVHNAGPANTCVCARRKRGAGVLIRCSLRLASALSPATFADCYANTFSNNIASECTSCPDNSFSTAGSSVCTCSAGYISPTGLTNLTACSGNVARRAYLCHMLAHNAHATSIVQTRTAQCSLPGWHVQQQRFDVVHHVPGWQH